MCGIAGIIDNVEKHSHLEVVTKMIATIRHRGPDDFGYWRSDCGAVNFGHARLSIIDLSKKASQPFISRDQRYSLVYNGEIYNYKELRAELERQGCQFVSSSDTEVLIEAYRVWGKNCVNRFKGMWAFVLFDKQERKLFISRDPFGIKPLYYSFYRGHFYFASEIKALKNINSFLGEHDDVTKRLFLENACIERGDWTFYKNIKRFPQAHASIVDLDKGFEKLNFERYWTPKNKYKSLNEKELVEVIREKFLDSVSLHLRSDIPVGACLSGGVDSSSIVCAMKRAEPDNLSIRTFTTHFPDHLKIDESSWAKMVIDYVGAEASFTVPTYESFVEDFDEVIRAQDEPFGSTSIFSQFCIFKKIKDSGIKVVLDGQGADEALGGYHGLLPYWLGSMLKDRKFYHYFRGLVDTSRLGNAGILSTHKSVYRNYSPSDLNKYLDNDQNKFNLESYEERLEFISFVPSSFQDFLVFMVIEGNLPQLLKYEDRNSMYASVESRVPFLIPDLVELFLFLPDELRMKQGLTKYLLRRAMKGIVPENVLNRRDKLGFPAPEVEWLKRFSGVDVSSPGSEQWREMVLERWEELDGQ